MNDRISHTSEPAKVAAVTVRPASTPAEGPSTADSDLDPRPVTVTPGTTTIDQALEIIIRSRRCALC